MRHTLDIGADSRGILICFMQGFGGCCKLHLRKAGRHRKANSGSITAQQLSPMCWKDLAMRQIRSVRRYGLYCAGCHHSTADTIAQGAASHGLDDCHIQKLLRELNEALVSCNPTRLKPSRMPRSRSAKSHGLDEPAEKHADSIDGTRQQCRSLLHAANAQSHFVYARTVSTDYQRAWRHQWNWACGGGTTWLCSHRSAESTNRITTAERLSASILSRVFRPLRHKMAAAVAAGDYGVTKDYQPHLKQILDIHQALSPLPHISKYELVKGDAVATVRNIFSGKSAHHCGAGLF